MTFGESNVRLPALLLIGCFVLCLAAMSAAQTSSQTEREGASTGWNVEQLLDSLATHRQAEVWFEETAFSNLLTHPLKTQGILRFTPPAGLEKHVTAPHDERYLIEGDTVFFENKTKGTNRTLSLQDYPVLQAFIEAFRSTLANDVSTLRRFYSVTLQGKPGRWVLILRPLDQSVQAVVESIRFSGGRKHISRVDILAPDGDRSVIIMTTGAQ